MSADGQFVVVAHLDELAVGEGRSVVLDGHQIAIFLLRSGEVRAVAATCPHAGGPIADGQVDEAVVVCPLHHHAFDLVTGEGTTEPTALPTYPVRLQDEWVSVAIPLG